MNCAIFGVLKHQIMLLWTIYCNLGANYIETFKSGLSFSLFVSGWYCCEIFIKWNTR